MHNNGEDDASAHLKHSVVGREVAVTDSRLDLEPWEQIFYREIYG